MCLLLSNHRRYILKLWKSECEVFLASVLLLVIETLCSWRYVHLSVLTALFALLTVRHTKHATYSDLSGSLVSCVFEFQVLWHPFRISKSGYLQTQRNSSHSTAMFSNGGRDTHGTPKALHRSVKWQVPLIAAGKPSLHTNWLINDIVWH